MTDTKFLNSYLEYFILILFSSIHSHIHSHIHTHSLPPDIYYMLHYFVSVQAYLTFQAGSTETGTGGKHCGLKRLGGGIGVKNFLGSIGGG